MIRRGPSSALFQVSSGPETSLPISGGHQLWMSGGAAFIRTETTHRKFQTMIVASSLRPLASIAAPKANLSPWYVVSKIVIPLSNAA